MALAEPAYRMDSLSGFAPDEKSQPTFSVSRTGSRSEQAPVNMLVVAAKMAAIVLVVVAGLAFARIALTNATVTTMIESDSLSSKITEARSTGVGLEMEQSVLSNPSAINSAARRLGMAAPSEVGSIALAPDVVTLDEQGDLSLSGTIKNLSALQG